MHTLKARLLLFAIAVFTTTTVWGQGLTGSISGVVKDPNGAVVPNAKVTAKNVATNAESVAQTDDTGFYRILNLVPADYLVTAEAAGFRRTVTSPQTLTIGQALRVDVNVEIGQVTESVTVVAAVSQINTENAQLGHAVTDIPNLPVLSGANGRNPLALASLMSGVAMSPPTGQPAPTNDIGPFSINGQRTQANNYILDGIDSNDLAINVPDSIGQISPNALAEFSIVTGAMRAEYGRNGGAVVEAITRSGSNSWHLVAEEVFRNTKLNATPFFQNVTPGGSPGFLPNGSARKPQWNTNDFDADFGGPIVKNKTFFFISYLGFRRRQGLTNSAIVFTDADRAAINATGVPAAKALLALVPRASSGNTLFSAPTNSLNRDQGLARVDHHFSDRNILAATFFIEKSNQFAPFAFGGSNVPGFGELDVTNYYNYVLRDTETFSSNLVNDARAGYHRRGTPGVLPVNHTTPASLGFTGINPDDAANAGPPWIIINGYSSFGNTIQGPQARFDNTWQYADTLSWIKGKHAFKFGGDFRAYEQNQLFTFINNGYFIFDGTAIQQQLVPNPAPGVSAPLNDFIHGVTTEYIQNSSSRQGYRDKFGSAFFQDDWKVMRNLTLNLGIRWEYDAPLTELNNHLNAFRRGEQSTVFPTAPVGLVYPGDPGVSKSTYNSDWKNFGPRAGFAWDPFSTGKVSIRGGYGLFYDAPISELTLQFLTAPPFGIQPFTLYDTDITHPYSSSTVNPIPNPFPFSPPRPGAAFNFANIAPVGLTVMDPNFSTPYSQQWNFQVQDQMAPNWLASVTYVGTNGVKLLYRSQIDPSIVTPNASTANTNQRRIYNLNNPLDAAYGGAVFAGITDQQSAANSNYSALQLELRTNLWHGLVMTHAYTWSHALDDASGLRVNDTGNVYNRKLDYGNSEFDIRHQYVGSVIYDLPWLKDQRGFAGHVLGGWTVSVIQTVHTGIPFDITESTDRCLCAGGGNRPDYIGGIVQFADPRANAFGAQNAYFNGIGGGTTTGAPNPNFARVGSGTSVALGAGRYGTFGRNVFHGPGTVETDFGLTKSFRLTESQHLQIRGEAFNLFNHTNFNNPQGSIASTAFGRVTTALDPRLVQLTARYQF
jgi:Carboxypeptidase regulatory-like domain/TonB-dependent Receptor Plug Domain